METNKKVVQANRPAFIKVSEEDENGIIRSIQYGYTVYAEEKKEGERFYSYYIPSFNIHFFAESEEDGRKIGHAAMTAFFNYWVKNQGKKAFFEEIVRLGFKEAKLKTNARRNIKFSALKASIPPAFNRAAYSVSSDRVAA